MTTITRTIRTYELFDIVFDTPDRKSRWTGFDTEAEAAKWAGEDGRIVRRTFEVDVTGREDLYRPGCSERVES